MPRVSSEAKAVSHANIIRTAAQKFREGGVEGTSLADIMAATGMTNGGFYRHFPSKDALAAAAIKFGVDESLSQLPEPVSTTTNANALAKFITNYLSDRHVDNPAHGCPIAALGPEAARGLAGEQEAMSSGVEATIARLEDHIGGSASQAREKATGLLSLLVGAVALMRAGPEQRREEVRASVLPLIYERLEK